VKLTLSDAEAQALVERIARWAVSLRIGSLVAFLLEVNRPVGPLTANACMAVAPLAAGLIPLPLHALGLLLQDDAAVQRLCARLRQLEDGNEAGPAASKAP
jgi:hypothetical protein